MRESGVTHPGGPSVSRRKFLVLSAGAIGGIAVGCAPTTPAAPAANKAATAAPAVASEYVDMLVLSAPNTGQNLDPAKSTTVPDWMVTQHIHNGLVRFKPGTYELEPDLATDWETSADGLTWTFRLREGVKFHRDFGEVTAEDVVFTFERQLAGGQGFLHTSSLEFLQGVQAEGDHTVRFLLKHPYGDFLETIALGRPSLGAIVSRRAIEQLGDSYGESPVGTGAYIITEHIARESWTMERNEDYFRGPAATPRLQVRAIPDQTTVGLAIEAAEVHRGDITDADVLARYKDHPDVSITAWDRFNLQCIHLNTKKEPLNDVRVRRALAHAMPINDLLQGVYGGYAVAPSPGYLTPMHVGFDQTLTPIPYDLDRAGELLREAGVSSLRLRDANYDGSDWIQKAQVVADHFRRIGVELDTEHLERGALAAARNEDNWDAYTVSFTRSPAVDVWLQYWHSGFAPPGGGLNLSRYDGADDLIDQQRVETNRERRLQLLRQIQAKFAQDIPTLGMAHSQTANLRTRKLEGDELDFIGGHWMEKARARK